MCKPFIFIKCKYHSTNSDAMTHILRHASLKLNEGDEHIHALLHLSKACVVAQAGMQVMSNCSHSCIFIFIVAVCKDDNQDLALTFNVLYWARNVMKKCMNKVMSAVPPQLPLTVFPNSSLFVHFSSFLLPWVIFLHLFFKMFSPTY